MEGEYFGADALFYIARDVHLGLNGRTQNVDLSDTLFKRALSKPDLSPRLREEAEWFLAKGYINNSSPRGVFVKGLLNDPDARYLDADPAAASGYSLAQAFEGKYRHCYVNGPEYLTRACLSKEPMAFYAASFLDETSYSDSYDFKWFAANHGLLVAAREMCLFWSNVQFELYFDCIAISTEKFDVLDRCEIHASRCKNVAVYYGFGKILSKHKCVRDVVLQNHHCKRCIEYYIGCNGDATRAITVWLLFSRFRLLFPREMRRAVAELIWVARVGWNEYGN